MVASDAGIDSTSPCTIVGACVVRENYNNNEDCTVTVSDHGTLTASSFHTENGWDKFKIGSTSYSGTTGPNAAEVNPSSTITFNSDSSVSKSGFTICFSPLGDELR